MVAFTDARAHLTKDMLDRLRQLLEDELAERREALAAANDDAELAGTIAATNAEAITEIEAALARMDEGTYGTCERCGAAIPFERLEAMPRARRCVGCPEHRTTSLFG